MEPFIITEEDERIKTLKKKDKRLSQLISIAKSVYCPMYTDGYAFIVEQIVSQMLSNASARKLIDKLKALAGGRIKADCISLLDVDDIASIGISKTKAGYILSFTNAVADGSLDLSKLEGISDADVMKELTSIKGIGNWTAKMYLLFVLQRQDILPYEDGAFLQAYKWLYETKNTKKDVVMKRCMKWSPYSSLASRFLYQALDSGLMKTPFSELAEK